MLRSMTAYGRAKKNYTDVEISIDIQSVNKKNLDVQIKMPYECLCFEPYVRKTISECIDRGQVTVIVQVVFLSSYPAKVHLNSGYAKLLKDSALVLARDLGCADVSVEGLLPIIFKEKGVLQVSLEGVESEAFQEKIQEVLLLACQELIAMKQKEGKALCQEFVDRVNLLESYREQISTLSQGSVDRYRKRLTDLLGEFTAEPTEERLAKEVAIMADRVDIAEELSRLSFHFENFTQTLGKVGGVGKVLEFILQEIQREFNTIGSKSQDAQVSGLVIASKGEIEKIREQVQNVE